MTSKCNDSLQGTVSPNYRRLYTSGSRQFCLDSSGASSNLQVPPLLNVTYVRWENTPLSTREDSNLLIRYIPFNPFT